MNESDSDQISHLKDVTKDERAARKSIEWSLYTDDDDWLETKSNNRQAKCKSCSKIIPSKRETMHNHIYNCKKSLVRF